MTGRNHHWLVGVSFGLLCLTQAALNIFLRLYVYKTTVNDGAQLENVTEERDELKRKLIDFDKNIAVTEARLKTVSEERDDLRRKLIDSGKSEDENTVIHFSDKYTMNIKTLEEEEDELKRKLTDFVQSQGWKYFRGSFYLISSEEKTWQDSRADCLQRGADLVMINSYEEEEFMKAFKEYIWLGLTRTETGWSWVDGTPLTTSYWSLEEPNNAGGHENCAGISNYDLEKCWNDESCDAKKLWTCEKTLE